MECNGLVVGLGNPGREYEKTRHNFGFLVLEHLLTACETEGVVRKLSGRSDPFHLWRCSLAGGTRADWLLGAPLTFMNRSGEAVQRIAAYYHVDAENILVLHDELDLPLGRMKLKKGGGNAGHNGLRSIQQSLGTADFYRLRLGIGKPAGFSGSAFVLGRFSSEERAALSEILPAAVTGVQLFMKEGARKAQQFCNGFALQTPYDAKI